jgi:hypothetical protein
MERRVPREIWVKRVARWRESGQTAPDFAAAHGLSVDRLRHWGWRLEKERYAATPASSIEILTPSGLRVCVPSKFDDDALRRVLAVVR